MTKLLSGKIIKDKIVDEILARNLNLSNFTVAVVYSTKNAEALSYVKMIEKTGVALGINMRLVEVDIVSDLLTIIKELNEERKVIGIVIARPLGLLDEVAAINTIDERKDIDGLSAYSLGLLASNMKGAILGGTPSSVAKILEHYQVDIVGKNVLVVGRSISVGKPIAFDLINKNATVTIAHSKTKNIAELARISDIIILASGVKDLIKPSDISPLTIVIDCGYHYENGQSSGDLSVVPNCQGYTPVPGGVGPLTIISLFENALRNVKMNEVFEGDIVLLSKSHPCQTKNKRFEVLTVGAMIRLKCLGCNGVIAIPKKKFYEELK